VLEMSGAQMNRKTKIMGRRFAITPEASVVSKVWSPVGGYSPTARTAHRVPRSDHTVLSRSDRFPSQDELQLLALSVEPPAPSEPAF